MGIQFVLASASPARRRLLKAAGIDPMVRASDFNESQVQMAEPEALVRTLALCKAQAIAAEISAEGTTTPTLVMGCDSVLALHGEIYGKPANAKDAIARWQQMRGQVGQLYTGHALIMLPQPSLTLVRCQVTQVHFAEVSDRQIAAYVATGEPLNCAGCFALEGKGSLFIEKIEGCHTNVIGLSLPLLRQMLAELNYDAIDFWTA
jgi:septum formation protein